MADKPGFLQQIKAFPENLWLYIQDIPEKHGKMFWYPVAGSPAILTFIFWSAYLMGYFGIHWKTALIFSAVFAVLTNIFILVFRFYFIVYVASIPELLARVLRFYVVQIALMYTTIPQIRDNLQLFLKSYVCSLELALLAGQEHASALIKNSVNNFKSKSSTSATRGLIDIRASQFYDDKYNQTINYIKTEVKRQVKESFDLFLLINRILGTIFAFNVMLLLVSKIRLVLSYKKTGNIKEGKFSKISLATNPIAIQLFILSLFGFLDVGVRSIYKLQQDVLKHEKINLSGSLTVNVTFVKKNEKILNFLASLVTKDYLIEGYSSMYLNLEECYSKDMQPLPILSFMIVFLVLVSGIYTYKLDISLRKNQKNIIEFAERCYANIFK